MPFDTARLPLRLRPECEEPRPEVSRCGRCRPFKPVSRRGVVNLIPLSHISPPKVCAASGRGAASAHGSEGKHASDLQASVRPGSRERKTESQQSSDAVSKKKKEKKTIEQQKLD